MAAEGDAAVQVRQNLLVLFTSIADPGSPVVAWSRWSGAPEHESARGPSSGGEGPPYPSVVHAMRDGWRVIQFPVMLPPDKDDPYTAAHLRHEFVLEKLVEVEVDG